MSRTDPVRLIPVAGPIDADVELPGSKSVTNRAFLIAALAEGRSTLTRVLESDDTRYMARALRTLGIGMERDLETATASVVGGGGVVPSAGASIHIGNAGTDSKSIGNGM